MPDVEVVMVPRDNGVAELIQFYTDGILTYEQLGAEFRKRGWSTLSLFENVRHITPKKRDNP